MKRIGHFFSTMLWMLVFTIGTGECACAQLPPEKDVDVKEIIFEHLGDAYEWHILTWGDKEVTIPLPVIVYSTSSGWHCFLSSTFTRAVEEGSGQVDGLTIAHDGDDEGKIVEWSDGQWQRPALDLSITKNVAALMVNSLLLVMVILFVARWYRRHPLHQTAPGGFVGFMEMFIMSVENDIVRSCVGNDYRRYSPYLLTVFFFIFLNNVMGLLPVFPGGANLTGNIAVTMVLALMTFCMVNLGANRHYWKDILWPEVPTWLKVPFPLMPIIELFGVFTKPFSLMVRLFANIFAGHSIILALVCVIFVAAKMGAGMTTGMTLVAVLFSIFMNFLELLVAYIQAYVFTMLSAVFIGMSRPAPVGHDRAHHPDKTTAARKNNENISSDNQTSNLYQPYKT